MAAAVIARFDSDHDVITVTYDAVTFAISAIGALFAQSPPAGTTIVVTFFDEVTQAVLLVFQWPNDASIAVPGGWTFNVATNRPTGIGVRWSWGRPVPLT